ncbi:hypothetical protein [Thermococcus sp. 2319x1]|uniref:hypothetical protein n=1 Tax=Thermococcus sp. 2319x1 TaxID=1674923 RepID=UPI001582C2BE|nr:hypothetical protein [Thermococcus sp. 2319x1]
MRGKFLSLLLGLLVFVLVGTAQMTVAEPTNQKEINPEQIAYFKDITITLHLQVGDVGHIYTASGTAEDGKPMAFHSIKIQAYDAFDKSYFKSR